MPPQEFSPVCESTALIFFCDFSSLFLNISPILASPPHSDLIASPDHSHTHACKLTHMHTQLLALSFFSTFTASLPHKSCLSLLSRLYLSSSFRLKLTSTASNHPTFLFLSHTSVSPLGCPLSPSFLFL